MHHCTQARGATWPNDRGGPAKCRPARGEGAKPKSLSVCGRCSHARLSNEQSCEQCRTLGISAHITYTIWVPSLRGCGLAPPQLRTSAGSWGRMIILPDPRRPQRPALIAGAVQSLAMWPLPPHLKHCPAEPLGQLREMCPVWPQWKHAFGDGAEGQLREMWPASPQW